MIKNRILNIAKILFSLLFLFNTTLSFSQINKKVINLPKYDQKWIHFGFTVGINQMDFKLKNSNNFLALNPDGSLIIDQIYGIECVSTTGFHLGPIAELRLGEYFTLRALIDVSFGQRNLQYKIAQDTALYDEAFRTHEMQIESIFIETPLLIKFRSKRLNNYRPYLIAGINPKIDMAARKKVKEEEKPKIRLSQYDLCYDVGFGIDFYMNFFKFSVELKYSGGLLDVIEPDATQYTDALEFLNSRIWTISFHFE